ncbi:MAG: hypothetical protein IH868_02635 [Chloroflexi bacterium]|nr:hypothetical protein [Chloroflexota bacterium]
MSPSTAAPEAPEERRQSPPSRQSPPEGNERPDEAENRKGFSGAVSDLRNWIARRLPFEPPLQ